MSGRVRNRGKFSSKGGHVGYERNTLLGLTRTESRISTSFLGPTGGEEVMASPLDDHFGCSSVDQIDAESSIIPQGILGEQAAILAAGHGESLVDGRVSHHDPILGIRKPFRIRIEVSVPDRVVDGEAAMAIRSLVPTLYPYR